MNVEELRQGILTMDNIPSEELRFDMLRQIAEITGGGTISMISRGVWPRLRCIRQLFWKLL